MPAAVETQRTLPIGAEPLPEGGVHFRVWAPDHRQVEVVVEGAGAFAMEPEGEGYFSAAVAEARNGTLYRFRLDGGDLLLPDPASRYQPEGPHGPSQVIDSAAFRWTDGAWQGVPLADLVIYEMHVGSFTPKGTFESAARELEELAAAGITMVEIMPVAEFPGRFGWGYDGVCLFAPTRNYGRPDDLRRFVDRAHDLGIGVIMDVVYNHLGPDGNYLPEFAKDYFTDRYENEWGRAINFDGPNARPVREFFLTNARYWIEEYHVDGLRLDATQQIFDESENHVLGEIARAAREAGGGRSIFIVGENEPQDITLALPREEGGYGLNALWNDDFHHSAMVALTGRAEAYYTDYLGKAQEFVSMAKYGFLFQGQRYKWQKQRRGTPSLRMSPKSYVNFIQNHDQVANSGRGLRCHELTDPGRLRAMTALLLLLPQTPMLFQGQEFAASAPFLYFADHKAELASSVREGRAEFLQQFRTLATPAMQALLRDPADQRTFEASKLDLSQRQTHGPVYRLHRDLLKLRREDPVFHGQEAEGLDGAVLDAAAFLLRFFGRKGDDRLLLVNFGRDLRLNPAPEPLLAPPAQRHWRPLWSSEDPAYGGHGTAPLETGDNWMIPGHAAIALTAASGAAI
ncbi:MAG: malto-oligosyltrehalose trehalohydrolase [Bryobacteraceae bacterium]|nr:malto-oligosyltrehalose trehalohydrolase [Bryobacteraceae bacterium]